MFNYKEAIRKLNKHTELYDSGTPVLSDKEWDDLYFQVVEYEKTHTPDKDSPTQNIHSNTLNKVEHSTPMLSLKKNFVPTRPFPLLSVMKCAGRVPGAWKSLSMKKIWWAMSVICPVIFILTETGLWWNRLKRRFPGFRE